MKKLFIIAMCLVSLGLASCNKEKANEQFIGNYAGAISGDVVVEIAMPGVQADPVSLGNQSMDVVLQLTAGENDDEVIANYELEGEVFSLKGVCNGTHVDFDPFQESMTIEGEEMDFLLNLQGDLVGNNLNVTGDVKAEGSIVVDEQIPFPVPVVISSTMTGALVKQ